MSEQDNTDWKQVAITSHKALVMCMNNLKAPHGSSGVIGTVQKDGSFDMKHWREIVADALENYPRCTVDREAFHALDLSQKSRDAFWRTREKEKKQEEK